MKKFICAILICLMLPITSLMLAGCNDKDYNLNTFYSTYQNIGNNAKNLTTTTIDNYTQTETTSYKIDIDYSMSDKLLTLVNESDTPYYYLKNFYQQLLDDSLSPLYFFGEKISNSQKVSDKQTKQLFNQLSALEQEYNDIDYYLGILINSLSATNDATINLSNLKKVFVQYEQAITVAGNLSSVICNIYFNTITSNSSYNYTYKTYDQLTEADLTRIAVDTRTRMHYYKSIYTNVYNQLYIRNNDWADLIITYSTITLPNYTPYDNIKNITSLETKTSSTLLAKRNEIYNNVNSLYHIQNTLEDAYNNFNIATSKVAYTNLNTSSTTNEVNYGNIISQFSNGIAVDSYEILNNLIDLLYI